MRRAILVPVALVALALAASCGDPLENYGVCTSVERARCALRDSCTPTFDYTGCAAYYDEFCRTRHVDHAYEAPTDAELAACVAAILVFDCEELKNTAAQGIDETNLIPECWFAHAPEEPDAGDAG